MNPIPHSSPDTSLTYVQGHIIKRHEKVYLNIYNLTTLNSCLRTCGIAIYHSAIEVYGVEYAFGGEFQPGETVIIRRSDGSLKFGIVKSLGLKGLADVTVEADKFQRGVAIKTIGKLFL